MEKYRKHMVIGGSVVAALAMVLAGFWLFSPKDGESLLTKLERSVAAVVAPSVTQAIAAPVFAFERLDIDTSKSEAAACLMFSRDLVANGSVRYADFVAIEDTSTNQPAKAAVRIVGKGLCLVGLDFNSVYNVTLKSGLPAADGDKLIEAESVPVELRDKPSVLRFAGGIILPREAMAGVPLVSVNVEKAHLKLIRVGDRLLSQIETDSVDETTLYSWGASEIEDNKGKLLWEGSVGIRSVKNDSVTTLIPLRKLLKNRKPGAYVLIAIDAAAKKDADGEYGYQSGKMAVQWVIDSDLALTSFKGGDGLNVFVRSYATAAPLKNVRLKLIARDNNVLADAETDGDGRARFDAGLFKIKGGETPVMVMAYGERGDFSFIDLRRSAFDLSDRGVSGRETPGPVDAYLYTERGVYRGGEIVQAVAMLRDAAAKATNAPLTLILTRPDGMEVARHFVRPDALMAGAAHWSVRLSKSAAHGRWQITAYTDPKGNPVGRAQFDVQDFVPQKLKVELAAETETVKPGETLRIKAKARFLYGAPAGGLTGEGVARIVADPTPFKAYAGWQFGRVEDEFQSADIDLTVPKTDADGVSVATAVLDKVAETSLPLKAKLRIDIHEPGGRTTAKSLEIRLRNHDVLIGIQPDFTGGSVNENARAGFKAIALSSAGKRIGLKDVTYSFVREDRSYQWYRDSSGWKYKYTVRDRLIASGVVSLGADAPLKLSQALPWGRYRLTLTDPKTRATSSYRYWSGWAASSEGDRPDRIAVASDKVKYRAGETAHIRIKPQSAGKALVVVAGEKIYSAENIDIAGREARVDVPIKAEWGAGAYVLVTTYKPLKGAGGHEPARAIGLTWLAVDNAPRTITPQIGGAKLVRPRQKVTVPVKIDGLARGEEAFLTLAAVDEGILQLTDYKSPDPAQYYYGKRRLGLDMRDDYGRLIKPEKGDVGAMREGGDSFGGRALAVVPTKTVALFSGMVKVGEDGTANVPIEVPDFNGELRLMAVAVAKNKLGAASRPLTVRDQVVADLVLPRFLAPDDKAMVALNMNNVEGRPGGYTAVLSVKGPLALADGGSVTRLSQRLDKGQRILLPVEIAGKGLGVGDIALRISGPGGFDVTHQWQIEVRSPQLDIATSDTAPLAAGASFRVDGGLIADVVPGSETVSVDVSAAHGFAQVPALLKWLDKYPYGCIEQTTSRAMPLLVFNDMAPLAGIETDRDLRIREQAAVDRVLDMQGLDGSFGMWGPGIGGGGWISAFALDFLMQAKAKNYVVPNEALRRGAAWLKRAASSTSHDDNVRAYAFYLLARAGQVNVSDLRYFSDTRGAEWNTVIAAALTGAAASHVGDRSRMSYGFKRAMEIAAKSRYETYPVGDYGSLLRDLAGAIALAGEANQAGLIPGLIAKAQSVGALYDLRGTTTQEKAWILRAAYELTRQRTKLDVAVNGKPAKIRGNAVHLAPDAKALGAGITVTNRGDGQIWRSVAVQGTPATPLPPMAQGLSLTKTLWTLDGNPVDPNNLHQNDRVIVVLSGQMANNAYRQMGAIDLLPAGFEIERPLGYDDDKRYSFIGKLSHTQRSDASDDRFVAAFDIGSRYRRHINDKTVVLPQFRIGYIARVVTAGEYVLPGAVVEDMYAPAVMGRSAIGKVTVKP